jgi:multidrug efflux pump subunit AcrB
MAFQHRNDLIGTFAQHKVAANLLMVMMLLAGAWALTQLNAQFFPNFEVEVVTVRTVWQGAGSEDVERGITVPMEQALRSVDGLDKMTSTSADNVSLVSLEFPEGTDMGDATDRVEGLVNTVRNLPSDSEKPQVTHVIRYEPVARLLVHGPTDIRELRPLVRRFERELLDAGIAQVSINGLPEEELAIQVPQARLDALGMSLGQVADRVAAESRDLPAGTVGRNEAGRELRAVSQQRDELGFSRLPLVTDAQGQLVRVGDVAQVERRPRPDQVAVSYQGKPAVELLLQRSATSDSLESAAIMQDWLANTRPTLPPGVELTVYDESWQLIEDRINLLLRNGASGLLLVVLILFLFLNGRVAFWVSLGIPTSFMLTLLVVYLIGGSINMISLFALIMALGIIVDDAIVVGEDALTHYQTGENSLQAAEGGARRMLAPVLSSSLTTIAAFIPLLVIGGIIGKILRDIPVVVICVILASLLESFLVLPGHLRHSFLRMQHAEPGSFRRRWDAGFARFRDGPFRRLVTRAVDYRWVTIAAALAAMLLVIGLVKGGRLGFTFFPNVEGNIVLASTQFVAGTPPERVQHYIRQVEQGLYQADQTLGGGLVRAAAVFDGQAAASGGRQGQQGEQFAMVQAELIPSDHRDVRNEQFLAEWRKQIGTPPGLENLTLTSRRGGHPGRDLEIRLAGNDSETLKQAGQALAASLSGVAGVSGIEDDMPYGPQQMVFRLTPLAESRGLTIAEVGRQLRGALDGYLAQIYNKAEEEVEVRVMLPDAERYHLAALRDFTFVLPDGSRMPLHSAIELTERRGFKAVRHADGRRAITVYADVDASQNNANEIRAELAKKVLPDLVARYGVDWSYTGRAEDQRDTLGDMGSGALFALGMIYIVLAWVFGSYGWPLVVMSIIPFGIVGAIFGHWVMGIQLTILSMFGLFGLAGIVVNDSIILVVFYKQLRTQGLSIRDAVVEASCQRLRAVLLTSLTTIAGLMPLLFETSLQAQFLIPMAVSISFGLALTTFLVLLEVPVLLYGMESLKARIVARWPRLAAPTAEPAGQEPGGG